MAPPKPNPTITLLMALPPYGFSLPRVPRIIAQLARLVRRVGILMPPLPKVRSLLGRGPHPAVAMRESERRWIPWA